MNLPRGSRSITILAVVTVVSAVQAQDRAADVAPGNPSIRQEELQADLSFLASDALQGRLTGTTGNELAMEFIRARFERLGLKPVASDGSFFQSYELMTNALGTSNEVTAQVAGKSVRSTLGDDFYPHRFSDSGHVEGPLVFAGFGIASPEDAYDDYRGADLSGRVALVLDHAPGETGAGRSRKTMFETEVATPLQKTLAAQAHGAVAILFVTDVHNHPSTGGSLGSETASAWPAGTPRIERYTLAAWTRRVRIPALEISREFASALLRPTGRSLAELARAAESTTGRTPVPVPDVRVNVSTSVLRTVVPDRNVVAALEGSDPRLRDEWVIVGAHLDHDGADGTTIFNGADDNGSGVAGLLEIAEAYAIAAEAGRRPRRGLLFAAWNSEERGLLGAWAYVEEPLVPLDRTLAVLNMDMIGRNEDVPTNTDYRFRGLEVQSARSNENAVNLLGYSYAPELSDEVTRANTALRLEIKRRYDDTVANLIRRSDQWPFLQRGIPAVWFFTGLHLDYHSPADRPDKINYAKLARVVRLVHQTSWLLAEREGSLPRVRR
jgi:Peptidase family M28/PA domain